MLNLFSRKKNCPNAQHWENPQNFDQVWKKRIEIMATYLNSGEQVLDFGCGMMWLENFLKNENKYVPIDFIKRDDRTIVFDLNRDDFPEIYGGIAFLSGVLEYINDIDKFILELKNRNYVKIILSYCTTEKIWKLSERKKLKWKNHESIFNLIRKFFPEYVLIALNDYISNNTILVFQRKDK